MPSDTGLIALGLIMLAGQIILYEMYQRGWFKKEIFKMNKSFQVATNKLQFEKLRKELGITDNPYKAPKKDIIEQVKGIDLDTVKSAVNTGLQMVQKKPEEDIFEEVEEDKKPIDMLIDGVKDYAQQNPEALKKLIDVATDKLSEVVKKPEPGEEHISQS